MKKNASDNMVGSLGHSSGQEGNWESYSDKDCRDFEIKQLPKEALEKITRNVESKAWGAKPTFTGYGELCVHESGQIQHVSEGEARGYRADMESTYRKIPEHYNYRNQEKTAVVKLELSTNTNAFIFLKAYYSLSPRNKHSLDNRGILRLAYETITQGEIDIEVHGQYGPDEHLQGEGFFGQLKRKLFGGIQSTNSWYKRAQEGFGGNGIE